MEHVSRRSIREPVSRVGEYPATVADVDAAVARRGAAAPARRAAPTPRAAPTRSAARSPRGCAPRGTRSSSWRRPRPACRRAALRGELGPHDRPARASRGVVAGRRPPRRDHRPRRPGRHAGRSPTCAACSCRSARSPCSAPRTSRSRSAPPAATPRARWPRAARSSSRAIRRTRDRARSSPRRSSAAVADAGLPDGTFAHLLAADHDVGGRARRPPGDRARSRSPARPAAAAR